MFPASYPMRRPWLQQYRGWIIGGAGALMVYLLITQWLMPRFWPPFLGTWKKGNIELTFKSGGQGTVATNVEGASRDASDLPGAIDNSQSRNRQFDGMTDGNSTSPILWKHSGTLLWIRNPQRNDWSDPFRWSISEDGQQLSLYSDGGVFTLYRF
ncbi:MAG TPA: hypothetical protein VHE55_08730 [Fimbriimonadaceae bacterium]|nr:hypothetical protein [Fimbriimonadaceae bacterium]